MLKIVIVMFPGGVRIVGWVDKYTLHPTGINRQETFEGIQVVTLDQEVFGDGIAVAEGWDRDQGAIRHLADCHDGLVLA